MPLIILTDKNKPITFQTEKKVLDQENVSDDFEGKQVIQ